MKNRVMLSVVVFVVSIMMTGYVFAEQGMGSPESNGGFSKDKRPDLKRELNLTPEQDKLLKSLRESGRSEMGSLMKALKAKHEELRIALGKPGVTRAQVEPIVTEIKAIQSRLTDHRIDGIFKTKQILTPEQFQKLQNMEKKWQKRPHRKHGERQP